MKGYVKWCFNRSYHEINDPDEIKLIIALFTMCKNKT